MSTMISPEQMMQNMIQMPNMAPVMVIPPVQEMAPVMEIPQMAPVTVIPPVQEMAPVMEIPQMAPVMEMAPVQEMNIVMEIPQMAPAQETNIGTQLNLQNGLELDNILTQEEEVKLNQKETIIEPIVIGGLESIGSCKTSTWSALITILDFIAKELSNNDIIAIDNGSIDTHRNGNFIHCDMKNILGNISLNLTSPDTSVKLLKLIKGGELIQIFKESSTNSYMFCNIQDGKILTRVKTSFAADAVSELSKAPTLPNPVFKKEIPNQEREILKTIIAGRAAIGSEEPFRFGFSKIDNSLVSVGVGKNFTYFFKDASIETDEYRVYNPFPVPNMESCIIQFFKCEDGSTWVKTISNISVSSIICTEKVEIIDSSIEDFNFN